MNIEPRIRVDDGPRRSSPAPRETRAVNVVLSLNWAQAIVRLQQLHNEGCILVRIGEDDQGRVRIDPAD